MDMSIPGPVQPPLNTVNHYGHFVGGVWPVSSSSNAPRILRSRLSDAEIPNLTFSEFVYGNIKKHGDQPFLTDASTSQVLTFEKVADLSHRVASALLGLPGYQRGQVVCVFSSNCPEYLIALLGVSAAGMVPALINPNLTAEEATRHVEEINTEILIASLDTEERVLQVIGSMKKTPKVYVFDDQYGRRSTKAQSFTVLTKDDGSRLTKLPTASDYDESLNDVIAIMLFSSGTSGLPKCVLLSHRTIIANLCNSRHPEIALYLDGGVVLCVLPLAHAYATLALMIPCLVRGIQVVLERKYTFEGALGAIEKFKVTCYPIVPPIAIRLLQEFERARDQYDLSSLTDFLCAAAPIAAEFEDALKKDYKVRRFRQLYGMTENSPLVSASPVNYHKPGSVGRLFPGNELMVADLETDAMLGPYERGEVWIRGPHVFKGYLNNEEATKDMVTSEGWMKTGDIGYYDDDEFIYLVDRKKEIIRYKCTQVAPAELEALLLGHPDIADVAVVGIPDPLAGELPRAYVVRSPLSKAIGQRIALSMKEQSEPDRKPEYFYARRIETEEDVYKFVEANAAAFKHLRGGVEFVDSIPKSPTGKILRRVLRQRYVAENRENSATLKINRH